MSETDPTGTTHNLKVDGQPAKLVEGRGRSKSFGLLMNDLAQRQSATIAELQSSLSAARAEVERLRDNSDRWLRLCRIMDRNKATVTMEIPNGHRVTCLGSRQLYEEIDQSRTKGQPR